MKIPPLNDYCTANGLLPSQATRVLPMINRLLRWLIRRAGITSFTMIALVSFFSAAQEITLDQPLVLPNVSTLSTTTQANDSTSPLDLIRKAKHKHNGITGCIRCHFEPLDRDHGKDILKRVSLTEAKIWEEKDMHSMASRVLNERRAQSMGDLLEKDVWFESTGCVQCHAPDYAKENWLDLNQREPALQVGVGCEVCHGASGGGDTGWFIQHSAAAWHEKTDMEKVETGFIPLHQSIVRADICLSCHLGSRRENRVITHEMYAAGHPPLAGFELETLAEKMPKHWQGEIGLKSTFVRTRHTLVATIVSLRLSVDLAAGASKDEPAPWPELARLDCFACHHDLRPDGWRLNRSQNTKAGKLQLYLGCIPLMRVAARVAGGDEKTMELDSMLQRINKSFNTNAFGNMSELVASEPLGKQIRGWCHNLEATLENMTIDQSVATSALADITEIVGYENHDFDTARQLTGAFIILAKELDDLRDVTDMASAQSALIGSLKKAFDLQIMEVHGTENTNRVENQYLRSLKNRAAFEPIKYSGMMKSLSTDHSK